MNAECPVPTIEAEASYAELKESLQSQGYWVRFFMRPCCPPPGESTARSQIERLKADLDTRSDMTGAQKDELKGIMDEKLDWYLKLPVRHTA